MNWIRNCFSAASIQGMCGGGWEDVFVCHCHSCREKLFPPFCSLSESINYVFLCSSCLAPAPGQDLPTVPPSSGVATNYVIKNLCRRQQLPGHGAHTALWGMATSREVYVAPSRVVCLLNANWLLRRYLVGSFRRRQSTPSYVAGSRPNDVRHRKHN